MTTSQEQLQYEKIKDRFGSYEERRDSNVAGTYVPFVPHAVVGDYVVEPNSGPKTGFRPTYFFDLNEVTSGRVVVTVSGDVLVGPSGTYSVFSYSTEVVDPSLPREDFSLADFLAATVDGLGEQPEIHFGVERDGTCMSIVGQVGYELGTVTVSVVE